MFASESSRRQRIFDRQRTRDSLLPKLRPGLRPLEWHGRSRRHRRLPRRQSVCQRKHIREGGAKAVVITAPAKNCPPVVRTINDEVLGGDDAPNVIQGVSCTTKSIVPWFIPLVTGSDGQESWEITRLGVITAHAATNTDRSVDFGSERGITANCVPGSTGAAKAVKSVIDAVNEGREQPFEAAGFSFRGPTPEGSITTAIFTVKGARGTVTTTSLHERLKGIVEGIAAPIASIFPYIKMEPSSSDVVGLSDSSVLYLPGCTVLEGTEGEDPLVFVRSYYPNVKGPATRYLELCLMAANIDLAPLDEKRVKLHAAS